MSKLVILGNGVTGASLAQRVRELDPNREIVLVSSESPYYFSRPALMYIYMGHMTEKHTRPFEDHVWDQWNIQRLQCHITSIDFKNKVCLTASNDSITYDELVLALGSVPNKFGWPGQDLEGVCGLYHLQDLHLMEKWTPSTQRAVIVGGGLIGIEMAEMLLSRGIQVTFLVREKMFWSSILPHEESALIMQHILEHHVDLRMETELREIVSDGQGRVKSVITTSGEVIPCQMVGLTAGVRPNVDFLKHSELPIDRGILVDHQLKTSLPNVYAAGDCAQFKEPFEGRRAIEQVWYTGKNQALTLAEVICGTPRDYIPGIWYNSAKFFDIEYQTYGVVTAKCSEQEQTLVWKDPKAHRLFRIHYAKQSRQVTGFNFLGIRARHRICEHWIAEGTSLEDVLKNLGALNFDPEFYKPFEKFVIETYNQSHPQHPIQLETSKGLFSRLHRLLGSK
jgi:3-phenylpropionate/trans-cinnamate dioxygenase ferredoxin reductase component